jgi:hypothetical protein
MFKIIKRKIKRFHHYLITKLFLKNQLRKQFGTSASFLQNCKISKKKIMVAMVELNHYQFMQVLSLAKALELRGAEIRVLICDEFLNGCEIKSIENESDKDPCWECRFNKKNIFSYFGFETVTYSDLISKNQLDEIEELSRELIFEKDIFYNDINLTTYVNDSIIRYYYGGDPKDNDDKSSTKLKHIRTAIINSIAAKTIDDIWSPDILLCNMSVYSVWGPIYHHFRDRVSMISLSDFDPKSVTYNFGDVISSRDRFKEYVSQRGNNKLNKAEKDEIAKFYEARYSGRDWLFQRNDFYNNSLSNQLVKSKLSIDSSKRNVFLFSNLFWDVGLNDQGRMYDDVISWIMHTIELLRNSKDIHLYIKTHPAEEFGTANSRKSVGSIIKEKFPKGLKNITIIEPALKLKPYSLFPFIDIAILYQGTLGFELLNHNIPIISCGTAAYNRLGLVHEPKNTEEYLNFIFNGKAIEFDRDLFDLLSYFYFKKVTIPWDISDASYGNTFKKPFNINNISDLLSKKSKIDHLCKVILENKSISPEIWKN